MNIGRKILILVIIALFSYIIYSLMQHRRSILSSIQEYKNKKIQIEGFAEDDDPNNDAIDADITKIYNKILVQIENENKPIVYKNYDSNNDSTTIKDMFIKASYNSAFTGRYLSSKMVKFCLSQGCRFLDFEVEKNTDNGIVEVTCKNTANSNNITNTTVSGAVKPAFLEVLKCTLDAAFKLNTGSTYPITNITDPLFINIRCSKDTYDNHVYPNILQKLMNDDNYKSYLDFNSGTTHFTDYNSSPPTMNLLKNKAIILFCSIDNKSNDSTPTNSNYSYDITNNNTRYSQQYSDITPKASTGTNTFTMVLSDPTNLDQTIPNPDVFTSVKDFGYTTTCISYSNYLTSSYLTQNERKYENIFTNFNYSFIPMASLKSYITSNSLYVRYVKP